MEYFSNLYTAICIVGVIVFGYLTAFEVLPLKIGFALFFMMMIMLLSSLISVLPEDNEMTIHQELLDAGHIDDDIKSRL